MSKSYECVLSVVEVDIEMTEIAEARIDEWSSCDVDVDLPLSEKRKTATVDSLKITAGCEF